MDTDPKQGGSLSHGLSRTGPKRCRIGLTHYVVETRQKPLANIKGRSGASPQQLRASVTPFLARVQQRIHTTPMRRRHGKIGKILDSMIAVIGR